MSLPKFSVENPVLVNMLMIAILAAGIYTGLTMTREMFPESRPRQVLISTVYPGATPEEVEKGISLRIEEAVKDVEYIDKIETTISEGVSAILISLTSDVTDLDDKVNEFKAAVDSIPRDEFPEDAEETTVIKFEPTLPVASVAIYGDADETTLKDAGRRLRDDLLLLPEISDVRLYGIRKDEITVEVEPEQLIAHHLSLAQVAGAIRQTNLDLPAGLVKTADQNVAVRTLGETDDATRVAETIVRTTEGGKVVRVRNLGRVIDAFEDTETRGRFNGKPAVDLTVYKTGDQDAIQIAEYIKAFVAAKRGEPLKTSWLSRLGMGGEVRRIYERSANEPYPAALTFEVHGDLSRYIADRLELVQRSGSWGLLLVFLTLLLTLNWRVAFWVMMGLVLSVMGGLLLMDMFGATLNLISMFGLIVVLGLIVDDAIVVGENIYARVERGEAPRLAAVRGTEEVTWPVLIAVTTTIGAFFPLMFIEGRIGDFMGVLPIVVMSALLISLLEALIILPSHLADTLRPVQATTAAAPATGFVSRLTAPLRNGQQALMQRFIMGPYERFLRAAVRNRYVTIAAALSALMLSLGLVAGGFVEFVFIQKMDSETILVNLEMPVGTPADQTEARLLDLERQILDADRFPEVRTAYTLVGTQIEAGGSEATSSSRSHLGQIMLELTTVDQRDRQSDEIVQDMRRSIGQVVGANSLRFVSMRGGPGGAEIEIEVTGRDIGMLLSAAERLKQELGRQVGVYDIDDDYERGAREMQIELLDSARPLGITTQSLATEIRGAFYGLEARTLQRDREDIDIRVRFAEPRRAHIYELERMRVATPLGTMVPISEVAQIEESESTASIRRIDQRRAVVVQADVDQNQNNAEKIIAAMTPMLSELERELPGVRVEFAGNKREATKSLGSLQRDFMIAILLIFVMLAGLFKSYIHPLVVLTAVPFGMTGAIVGHFVMGYPLTILSMIGLVALTGIVVNDALILVDFINKERREGKLLFEAVISAGRRRLRPIILTSLTTILGLAPLMMEQSFQARFLIPMAISISFGLGFATVLTLVVVPSLFMIAEDAKRAIAWLRGVEMPSPTAGAYEPVEPT
jgi:HAE1 family hydrophobic/amphiphilic exporter-1